MGRSVWRVRGVPRVRDALLESRRSVKRLLLQEVNPSPEQVRFAAREVTALEQAHLVWATADMVAVAVDASRDIPTLSGAVPPTSAGFVALERSLPPLVVEWVRTAAFGVPARVPVDAFVWDHTGDQVFVVALTRNRHLAGADFSSPTDHPDVLVPTFTFEVPICTELTEDSLGQVSPALVWLVTAWSLMSTPTVTDHHLVDARTGATTPVPVNHALTEAQQVRRSLQVRVIDVHAPRHATHDDDSGDGATTAQVRDHRWLVRGHWRNQPYGPQRSFRKPVWVPSYIKGPADAPLKTVETVWKW